MRGTRKRQCRGLGETLSVSVADLDRLWPIWVVITDAPVYMCERGGGNAGSAAPSLLSYTLLRVKLHTKLFMVD